MASEGSSSECGPEARLVTVWVEGLKCQLAKDLVPVVIQHLKQSGFIVKTEEECR